MSPVIMFAVFGIPLLAPLFLCPVEANVEKIERSTVKILTASTIFGSKPELDDAKCQEAGGNSAVELVAVEIDDVINNCIKCKIDDCPDGNPYFLMFESDGKWYKVVYDCEE